MRSSTVKITRKGQVTFPKAIRDALGSNAVYFEVESGVVTVKPVRDAAGSLREFARNAPPNRSMNKMKDQAWEEAVREKDATKPS